MGKSFSPFTAHFWPPPSPSPSAFHLLPIFALMSPDQIKQLLGREAAKLVQPGMTIGIGSGSTASHFIRALAYRIRDGLVCKGVPTSQRTVALATELNIPLITLDEADEIQLAIDGADEVSEQLNLVKGGGGALLQEKMVADTAQQFVVIAHDEKLHKNLGSFPLPVEVVPYGWQQVKKKIERTGCKKVLLRMKNDKPFITDHGHYILDCEYDEILYPATLHSKLNNLPGVVENGMFINMADMAMIGHADGTITEMVRSEV